MPTRIERTKLNKNFLSLKIVRCDIIYLQGFSTGEVSQNKFPIEAKWKTVDS